VRRREHIEPDDVVALVSENARQRLAEVTRAAGDEDPHTTRHIRTDCW
jgi:hypothetical protein